MMYYTRETDDVTGSYAPLVRLRQREVVTSRLPLDSGMLFIQLMFSCTKWVVAHHTLLLFSGATCVIYIIRAMCSPCKCYEANSANAPVGGKPLIRVGEICVKTGIIALWSSEKHILISW